MRVTTACAVAVLAALIAAGPAAAKLKPATFRLEIKGEQLTTWSYAKDVQPTCDWPETESGRQYIRFNTYTVGDSARPKVKAKPAAGGGVRLKFARENVTLQAEAELERTYDRLYGQQSECPDPGSSGGTGDPAPDVHGTSRCEALGDLDLYLGTGLDEVENPSYPTDLADAKPPKAPLFFAADPWWVGSDASDHNLPAACAASGQADADIGVVESQGEWAGALIPVGGSLPAAKLLDRKRKKTVVELGRTVKYPNAVQTYVGAPQTTGQTRIDMTLAFKRTR
jgi:hypothetical protein